MPVVLLLGEARQGIEGHDGRAEVVPRPVDIEWRLVEKETETEMKVVPARP